MRSVHLMNKTIIAAGVSTLAFMAASANAQEAPAATPAPAEAAAPASGGGVEEIVVTAQFRSQNLQKTPLAITAVSGAMLEARSQTNIAQVANDAPSVTLKPQGAAYGPSIAASIRGIGQYDFNPALEPGVGMYIDDVYYATLTGGVFDLLDLDRVEVLRGPQGTLAGKNSIGGAIKLYSKKPVGDNTGYVSATYGSRNRVDLRGSADFGITDNLFARVSGVSKKQDGYVTRYDYGCLNPGQGIPQFKSSNTNCVLDKEGEIGYNALRGQLRWEANDRLEINLIGDYTHEDHTVAGSVLTYANYTGTGDIDPFGTGGTVDSRFLCGKYCNYATFYSGADGTRAAQIANGRTKFEGWGTSGTIDYKLNDTMSIKSVTAYRQYHSLFTNDDDLTPLAHSFGSGNLKFHQFSEELRLNGSFADEMFEYTVGGYYLDEKSVYATFQDLRYTSPAGTTFQGNDPVNADTKAVFAHLTWHVTDKLSAIGGIRYTDEHKDYTFSRKLSDGVTPANAVDGVKGVYNGKRVDYRANLQYQFTPTFMAYAQFSTGFKGGGVNPRPFYASQVLSFDPETLQSYELGAKTELFDRMLRLNGALFYSKYKDIQLSLSNCPQAGAGFAVPCALPFNAGNADIQGAELEANFRPTDALTIDASASYVDFDYTSVLAGTGVTKGMRTPYNPKWKWSMGVQYEIDLGDAGSLTPRIDASYQSMVYSNAINAATNRIPSYTIANARLTYRNTDNDWEASLEVTNLFDKYYFLTNFDLVRTGAGISSSQPGRPREWALTLKKRF